MLDRYRAEAGLANAAVAAADADAPPAWWPHHLFGAPHLHTVRDVLLHVITETACHAGHLDAARELIDGRRWLVLT
ncbi:mycothiol transferase [Streptomyces antibioticus]|uniref:mycothiol transferase n=1 Tax=Streptomyces antibioticus TaxID=1890 RepID=UPI0036FF87A0